MSYELVICSNCKREVHQGGEGWYHCEDGTLIARTTCRGATMIYPKSKDEIVGKWCGVDNAPFEFGTMKADESYRPISHGGPNRKARRAAAKQARRRK